MLVAVGSGEGVAVAGTVSVADGDGLDVAVESTAASSRFVDSGGSAEFTPGSSGVGGTVSSIEEESESDPLQAERISKVRSAIAIGSHQRLALLPLNIDHLTTLYEPRPDPARQDTRRHGQHTARPDQASLLEPATLGRFSLRRPIAPGDRTAHRHALDEREADIHLDFRELHSLSRTLRDARSGLGLAPLLPSRGCALSQLNEIRSQR